MAFEQTVKNLDNCLRTDKGCTSELDYVEQTSWILFLKYLDDLEKSKQIEAELQDKTYQPLWFKYNGEILADLRDRLEKDSSTQ